MRNPRDPRNREDDSNNCKSVHGTGNILLKQTRAQKSGVPLNRMTHNSEFRLKAALENTRNSAVTLFINFDHVHVANTRNAERWRPQLYTVSRIFTHAHWKWVTRDFEAAGFPLLNSTAPCFG